MEPASARVASFGSAGRSAVSWRTHTRSGYAHATNDRSATAVLYGSLGSRSGARRINQSTKPAALSYTGLGATSAGT